MQEQEDESWGPWQPQQEPAPAQQSEIELGQRAARNRKSQQQDFAAIMQGPATHQPKHQPWAPVSQIEQHNSDKRYQRYKDGGHPRGTRGSRP